MRGAELFSSPEDELPRLWQKPAYEVLLETLKKLRVEPRVWSLQDSRADILKEQAATAYDRREVVAFLSSIIKSGLPWLDSDDEREVIWEEASKRMSERCGRTGMSTLRALPVEERVKCGSGQREEEASPETRRAM